MEDKKPKFFKKIIIIFIFLVLIICTFLLYARYISTAGLDIKEYKIQNENITDNFHGLKIVHISDIHYKTTIDKKKLCNLSKKVNKTKPDIIVFTGDLIDKEINYDKNDFKNISECLNNMSATLGKYAIMGEHDYSYEFFTTLLENSGFINLNDSYDYIYKNDQNFILLAGLSSSTNKDKSIEEKQQLINELNQKEEKPIYSILLVHEPDIIDDIDISQFSLILAGHSHNGQVNVPILRNSLLPDLAKKYNKEQYKKDNTDIFISNGIGTSHINFRFWNKPSFNLYRITKK